MKPDEFVKLFHDEKEMILNLYFHGKTASGDGVKTEVGERIKALNLTQEQTNSLYKIFDLAISETMYTILLGIDGEASIGGHQESYKLFDSTDNQLTVCGEIEASAYEYFMEQA